MAGSVTLKGEDVTGSRPERILALGCSLVPEGRKLFAPMTVRENLELGGYAIRRHYGGNKGRKESEADLDSITSSSPCSSGGSGSSPAPCRGASSSAAIGRSQGRRPRTGRLDEPSMGLAPS